MNNSSLQDSDGSPAPLKLSVIIPAYNEETRIQTTLDDYLAFLSQTYRDSFELIVINDGSNDSTSDILSTMQRKKNGEYLSATNLPTNMGKGEAVRTGLLQACGQYVLMADADGSTPIEELSRLMHCMAHENADIVIGSRALPSSETKIEAKWYRRLLGRIFSGCVNLLLIPGIEDTQCGFKLYTSHAAKLLAERQTIAHYAFDLEHLYIAHQQKLCVREVSINWFHRSGSKVHVIRDGLKMLAAIPLIRWRHRSP